MEPVGFLFLLAFVVAPIVRIFVRIGVNPWYTILLFIPLVNIILLNYAATAKWPFNVVFEPVTTSQDN